MVERTINKPSENGKIGKEGSQTLSSSLSGSPDAKSNGVRFIESDEVDDSTPVFSVDTPSKLEQLRARNRNLRKSGTERIARSRILLAHASSANDDETISEALDSSASPPMHKAEGSSSIRDEETPPSRPQHELLLQTENDILISSPSETAILDHQEKFSKLTSQSNTYENKIAILQKQALVASSENGAPTHVPRIATEEAQMLIKSLEKENKNLMLRVKEVEKSAASRRQIESQIQRSSATIMATERAMTEAKTSALEAKIESLQDDSDRTKHYEEQVATLETQIKAERSITADLKSKVDEQERILTLETENKELKLQLKQLEKEAQSHMIVQTQVRRSSSVVMNTERALADAKCSALQAEIDSAQEKIQEKHENFSKQKTALEEKIEETRSKNASILKRHSSDDIPGVRILEGENKKLKQQLKRLLAENEARNDVALQVRRSSSTIVATERAMTEAKIAALETELESRKEELKKGEIIQKELKDLESRIKASREISSDLGKRIAEKIGKRETRHSLDWLHPRLEALEKENKHLSKELNTLQKEFSGRNEIQAKLQRSSSAMAATARAMTNAKLSALESEAECLREKLHAVEAYKRQVMDLEAAVEDSRRKGNTALNKVVELSKVNGTANPQADGRKRVHILEKENADIRNQLKAAKQKEVAQEKIETQVRRSSRAIMATERSITEAKVAAMEAEIHSLKKNIDDGSQYKQQAEQLEKRVKETQQRNQSMISRLGVSIIKRLVIQSESSGENVLEDDLRFTLNSLQQENRGLKKELKAEEDAALSRIQIVAKSRRSSIAIMKTGRALAEAKISALESELESLQGDLEQGDQYSEKIDGLKSQLQEQESKNDQLVKRLVDKAKESKVSVESTKALDCEGIKERSPTEIDITEEKRTRAVEAHANELTAGMLQIISEGEASDHAKEANAFESKVRNSKDKNQVLVKRFDQNIATELENQTEDGSDEREEAVRLKLRTLQDQNRILKKQLKSGEERVASQNEIESRRRRSSLIMIGTERAMAEARYSALEAEVDKLEEELELNEQYEQQAKTLQDELQKVRFMNEKLKGSVRDAKGDRREEILSRAKCLEDENIDLRNKLESLREAANSRAKIDEEFQRSSAETRSSERSLADAKYSALEATLESLLDELEEAETFEDEVAKLEAELGVERERTERLLSQTYSDESGAQSGVNMRLGALQLENKELKKKLRDGEKARISSEKIESQFRRSSNAMISTERAMTEAKLTALEMELESIEDALKDLERTKEKCDGLRGDLIAAEHKNEDLRRSLIQLSNQDEDQEASKLQVLEKKNRTLKDDLKAMRKQVKEQSQIERQVKKSSGTMIATDRALSDAKISSLESEIQSLETQIQREIDKVDGYKLQAQSLEAVLFSIQEANKGMLRRLGDNIVLRLADEGSESKGLSAEEQDHLDTLEQENKELRKELSLVDAKATNRQQMDEKIRRSSTAMLATERAISSAKFSSLEAEIEDLEEELKETEKFKAKVDLLRNDLTVAERKSENLISRLVKQSSDPSMVSPRDKAQARIQDLKKENKEIKIKLQTVQEEAVSRDQINYQESQDAREKILEERSLAEEKISTLERRRDQILDDIEEVNRKKEELKQLSTVLKEVMTRNEDLARKLDESAPLPKGVDGEHSGSVLLLQDELARLREAQQTDAANARRAIASMEAENLDLKQRLQSWNQKSFARMSQMAKAIAEEETMLLEAELDRLEDELESALKYKERAIQLESELHAEKRKNIDLSKMFEQQSYHEATAQVEAWDKIKFLEVVNSELKQKLKDSQKETASLKESAIQTQNGSEMTVLANTPQNDEKLSGKIESLERALLEEKARNEELVKMLAFEQQSRQTMSEGDKKRIQDLGDLNDDLRRRMKNLEEEALSQKELFATEKAASAMKYAKLNLRYENVRKALERAIQFKEKLETMALKLEKSKLKNDQLEKELKVISRASFWDTDIGSGNLSVREIVQRIEASEENVVVENDPKLAKTSLRRSISATKLEKSVIHSEGQPSSDGRESYLEKELVSCRNRLQEERHLLSCLATELNDALCREAQVRIELNVCLEKLESISGENFAPSKARHHQSTAMQSTTRPLSEEDDLEQKHIESNEALLHAREEADKACARLEILETKLQVADSELESLRKSSRKTEADLRLEITRIRGEVSQQEFANDTLKEVIMNLNKMNDDLQVKHDKLINETNHLRTQNKNFTQSISKLQVFSEKTKHGDIEKEFFKLSDECKFLRNQKKGFLRDIAKFEKQLGAVSNEREALQSSEKELKARIDALVMANQQLEKSLEQKDTRIAKKLEDSLSRNKWLEGQLTEAQKSVTELTQKNEALIEKNDVADRNARGSVLGRELSALRQEVQVSKKSLKESVQEEDEWMKTLEGLRSELFRVSKEKKALVAERDSLRYILDSIEDKRKEKKRKEKSSSKPQTKEKAESEKSKSSFWGF